VRRRAEFVRIEQVRLAVRDVIKTRTYPIPAEQHAFTAVHKSRRGPISRVLKPYETSSPGNDIMKKVLATVALLAIAGTAVALAHTIHHKAMQSSRQQVVGAAAQSTALGYRRRSEERGGRSPFELCQHQDPTTPAVRIGSSECLPLPY